HRTGALLRRRALAAVPLVVPRLEDLDILDIQFLAPAASTPFGQRRASRPFGAAEGRHALGPELAGRARGEMDHHTMAVEAAHAGAVVQPAVLVDGLELDAHAAPSIIPTPSRSL